MRNNVYNERDIFRLLMGAYLKVLRIDLDDDTFDEIKVSSDETDADSGYSDRLSEWFKGFAMTGHVHQDDLKRYLAFTDRDHLLEEFSSGKESLSIIYRRLSMDQFRWVKLFMQRSYDYTDDYRIVILCIEDIHDEVTSTAEIEHTNAMLKEALSAAVAANSAKSEFMSRMSHDIRTPLNGIIGMTAIAGAHLDEKEKVADCLGKIDGAGRHLLSLINDILDLSKIESGKVSMTDSEFNLRDLLDDLLGMIHGTVMEHGHDLEVYIQRIEHENVIGDNVRLQQVFMNLLSNAVKYTPNHGKIRLTLTEEPSKSSKIAGYSFSVEDNGYGMSEEFQKKLFEPFERADDARIGQIQGTGLGMAIARNIVHMMGGEIEVQSKENIGTKFTVSFKLKLQPDAYMDTEQLRGLSVLVVDDDSIICESTCLTLDELGMKGEAVLSGRDALEKIEEAHRSGNDYHACLIDWKMPEMDGIETAKRIREVCGSDMTIILISAYDWEDVEEDARACGVDAFISKPLFKSRLHAAFTDLPTTMRNTDAAHHLDDLESKDYSGRRFLLVEDNELNREIAQEILSATGALVETAENGQAALDMFEDALPGYFDMIFMDVQMPVMDGYEASRRIRAFESDRTDSSPIPIVALTANAFVEDAAEVYKAGMNEHMAKPIDLSQLLHIMERYLDEN